jgi:hypothetical protein
MRKQTKILGKALSGALLLLAVQTTQAQTVVNGGFEAGPTLCTNGNNGPFSLRHGWVSSWMGNNNSPTADPSDAPGFVYDQTATCTGGQYAAGNGPEYGNRSISLIQNKKFNIFKVDGMVGGSFSQPLLAEKYDLCVMMRGNGWYPQPPPGSGFPTIPYVAPIVQIFAVSSYGWDPEMLLGEFVVTNTTGWNIYSALFTVSTANSYDKVKIKLKQQSPSASPYNYDLNVEIDELKIEPVRLGGTMCHYGMGLLKGTASMPASNNLINATPNPASDVLHIDLDNGLDLTNTVLTIVDLQGKTIRTIKNPSVNRLELNISDLLSGMYFIKLQSGATSASLKFIKQ